MKFKKLIKQLGKKCFIPVGTIPKGQITTKCHVNSLARIESVWVFNEGLISQIKSFPKIIQSRQSSLHLNLSLSVADKFSLR